MTESYTNHYFHCGETWEDSDCDSMHNDRCPTCNKEIEPFKSVNNDTGVVVNHCDPTEDARRQRQDELNAEQADRAKLEATHGKVWNLEELRKEFEITGFMAPFVGARRRSDGKKGSLEFQHSPRFYFNWQEDK